MDSERLKWTNPEVLLFETKKKGRLLHLYQVLVKKSPVKNVKTSKQ